VTKDGQGFAKRITLANLAEFLPLLRRATKPAADEPEGDVEEPAPPPPVDPALAAAQAKFAGKSIKVHLPLKRAAASASGAGAGVPAAATPAPVLPPTTATRGPEVWRKKLSATDAQRQQGNPTGDLRLAMGAYRGKIDHTTYFREKLFGSFTWAPEKQGPLVETTQVQFDITILGKKLGVYTLTVSHKPSGEAGQSNYTTGLRWGDLAATLQAVDVTGRTLAIYAPVPGSKEPFFLEIV